MSPLASALHDLSDALGDAHDMVVLDERLHAGDADLTVLPPDLTPVAAVIGGFRHVLEQRAPALGARLHVESADRT